MVVCLSLGAMPALAQEESPPPFYEGVFVEAVPGGGNVDIRGYDRWLEDGLIYARATGIEGAGSYSDPRLNGTWRTAEYHDACFTTTGEVYGPSNCIFWSQPVVTDDDGTWSGHETCLDIVQNTVRRCMGIYEGGGAYEGLSYIETYEWNQDTGQTTDLHGIIYEGPPPPWEVPSPPSE
jgi:hypothetical protein